MNEKGGEDESNRSVGSNYINYKIVLTAILTVLSGTIIVLTLMFFGMQVSHKYDQEQLAANRPAPDEVEKVIEIEYEATEYHYTADTLYSETDHQLDMVFEQLDVKTPYYVIDTQEKLENVLGAITRVSNKEIVAPEIEENFFTSGTIILASVQDRGLGMGRVTGVHRDADYNVFVTLQKSAFLDTTNYSGVIFLIKIPNIQPGKVTVSVNKGE